MDKGVDVLAVLDDAYSNAGDRRGVEIYKARKSVAELIESATAWRQGEHHDSAIEDSREYQLRRASEAFRLDDALARVTGGAA